MAPLPVVAPLLLVGGFVVIAAVFTLPLWRRRSNAGQRVRRGPDDSATDPVSFSSDQLSVADERGGRHSHTGGESHAHHHASDGGWSGGDASGSSDSASSDSGGSDGGGSDGGGGTSD